MDAFLFIGYRVDAQNPEIDCWDMDTTKQIPKCYPCGGISFGEDEYEWGFWPSVEPQVDSFLYTGIKPYYECPMGQHALWSDLNLENIDLPNNHNEIVEKIENSDTFKAIKNLYGNAEVKYGIFKSPS